MSELPGGTVQLVGGVAITVFYMLLFTGSIHPDVPNLHFFYIGGISEVTIMIGIAIVALATAPPITRNRAVRAAPGTSRRL